MAALANQRLRDRALALVAQALAAGQQPDLALATARMAGDREVRARSLIDLSLQRLPNAALALAHAAEDVAALADDERAPLVAALAAAQAAAGQAEAGLATAGTLPEGEERDRAQSRVAVALARNDAAAQACQVAQAIADDDERDWALDEISRIVAYQGDWDAAFLLTAQITDAQQRARTEVDLVIAWARASHAAEAHEQAAQIALATERQRAQATIVEPLIAQGGRNIALATLTQLHEPNIRSRYQAALAAALAAHGELVAAHGMARAVPRPLDRAARSRTSPGTARTPTPPRAGWRSARRCGWGRRSVGRRLSSAWSGWPRHWRRWAAPSSPASRHKRPGRGR